jgi:hypothetical protein
MTRFIIPSLEQATELAKTAYADAYYGRIKMQKNRLVDALTSSGYYIRNANGAKIQRYTISCTMYPIYSYITEWYSSEETREQDEQDYITK